MLALWALAAAAACRPRASPPDVAPKPLPAGEARKWLARIHAAAHERNYQGTLVFSADGAVSSARVAHFCDGAQSYERVEVLDGRCSRPTATTTASTRCGRTAAWRWSRSAIRARPRCGQVIEPRAEEQYELREQGSEHVAGREAQILLLSPRDEHRFAQRLWIDSRSGLMLRADVLGPRAAGARIQRVLRRSRSASSRGRKACCSR